MPSELKRFLLIYSSQTGQAKAIAEEVAEKAAEHGLEAEVRCISETEKRFWLEREKLVVIITSTTGDGDVPDTAHKFWRRLKKKTLDRTHLNDLRFSLLGLGDSNYSNFCNCAKNFDRRLKELGAVPFLDTRWADDAVGLEQEVEPWIEAVFPALHKELYADPDTVVDTLIESSVTVNGDHIDGLLADSSDSTTVTEIPNSKITDQLSTDKYANSDIMNGHSSTPDTASTTDGSAVNKTSDSTDRLETANSETVVDPPSNSTVSNITPSGSTLQSQNINDNKLMESTSEDKSPSVRTSTADLAVTVSAGGDSSVNQLTGGGVQPTVGAEDGSGVEETLVRGVPPLSDGALTLPLLPAPYLTLTYTPHTQLPESRPEMQNGCPFPSAKSGVVMATIIHAEQLTRDDAVKKTLKISLQLEDNSWDWGPGDSFGILCPNDDQEVDALLTRLGVDGDTPYQLEVIPGTKKRAAAVPPHMAAAGTLRQVLTFCCDIRAPPKKALLRCLVDSCSAPAEACRLQELCSKQGADTYTRLIRQPGISVLDLLTAFPSCTPPVERLLEHLPRLKPRPYSAASSPVVNGQRVEMVFNVVDIPAGEGRCRQRHGVCTGYLDKVTAARQTRSGNNLPQGQSQLKGQGHDDDQLTHELDSLHIKDLPQVPIYLRNNQHFRPLAALKQPVLMIGPGTGVAPFIGFLQEREKAIADTPQNTDIGECWLFFGCRHKERDFIFRSELERYDQLGVLSQLLVSYSRDVGDGDRPRYVQDMVRCHAEKVLSLIVDSDAIVYVCGDARGMARGVIDTFTELLQTHRGFTKEEAADYIKQMRLSQRYKEDVWT